MGSPVDMSAARTVPTRRAWACISCKKVLGIIKNPNSLLLVLEVNVLPPNFNASRLSYQTRITSIACLSKLLVATADIDPDFWDQQVDDTIEQIAMVCCDYVQLRGTVKWKGEGPHTRTSANAPARPMPD